ncbi:helix-turn-helix domain-containing protein [Clostridium paraputrificum]|uniref:helix-turn-helix domain-containing protein n=1 Tax=Clostridium paraputrificum TaxID=29363 RepID=UPI000425BF05|nr:helix-turn-helix domain-containing protein [Clostridium paraputrificum]MDB2122848.1 helix-turn-helix domain-containing protein [Clostridium paraputrificum]
MNEVEKQPITIQEYREKIKKKTCNIKELSEILGVSEAKARRIARIEGFPKLKIGRDIRVILSKLDDFLEEHIGECL